MLLAVGDVHFELGPAITLPWVKSGHTYGRGPVGLVVATDHAPSRQRWEEAGLGWSRAPTDLTPSL